MTTQASPIAPSKRIIILDALRGFALMGIALANFPEFSLWTFLADGEQQAMPTASADHVIRWVQYWLVDGKFYTIFSILFGIGFSIIIGNAMKRGANGFRIFYRRMFLLLLIGFCHMMFLWSGDILMLYAAMGLLLPLFRNCKPKQLLGWAAFFFLLPIVISVFRTTSGMDPSSWLYDRWWNAASSQGITEENFASWLRDVQSYPQVFAFLLQGAVERMWEFVCGQRYFKVLGLFLIGYYIGRKDLFRHLEEHRAQLQKAAGWGFGLGLPLSALYAWDSMHGHPFGAAAHELLYAISVYPLGIAYMAGLCLLYLGRQRSVLWKMLSYPGRMALTCYIGQSLAGIFLFYGIGMGHGLSVGLWQTEVISIIVFATEIAVSSIWLRYFNFGPLEWVWRMLTYGKRFPLTKKHSGE